MDNKSLAGRSSGSQPLYCIRPMLEVDIPQAKRIEMESFPEMWPPSPMRSELSNSLARYLVACQIPEFSETSNSSHSNNKNDGFWRKIWTKATGNGSDARDFLLGYVGIWLIGENGRDAHIVSIATKKSCRGRGVGEILLIGAIEIAILNRCKIVTLEVRKSNYVAQSLYRKYGFAVAGMRKAYYSDNQEDAIIMTTGTLDDAEVIRKFESLKRNHERRWGSVYREVD